MLELWGLGDVALAIPFLRAASARLPVTLVAKPHATALLRQLAPAVELVPFVAPWTAFSGKYRLQRWPWRALARLRHELRSRRCDIGVSPRPDPRDHALLALAGVRRRVGFPRAGSRVLLTDPLPHPPHPHRAEHWRALARHLGFAWPEAAAPRPGRARRIVIHPGAGHRVRAWPRERFDAIAERLREKAWDVVLVDDTTNDLDALLHALGSAERFIGNDSGPGHIAALLGVPTFTVFGPQLPELFAPQHPHAAWIEGAPCPYKPCWDACRFPAPNCLLALSVDDVWQRLQPWLDEPA